MEVILDELTPLEFFSHGGIVKITICDKLAKECDVKKKYTFFNYKSYIQFFKNLYMTYLHNHPNENTYNLYKAVNENLEISPSIGTSEYVVDLKYDHVWSYETAKFYYSNDKRDQEILPKDPYGIQNVCFSMIDNKDTDWDKYEKQRLQRGFDDSETWNFDGTIAKFIYPRLLVFIEDVKSIECHPSDISFNDWVDILKTMAEGFRLITQDDDKTDDEYNLIEKALDLFRKYYHNLWT